MQTANYTPIKYKLQTKYKILTGYTCRLWEGGSNEIFVMTERKCSGLKVEEKDNIII